MTQTWVCVFLSDSLAPQLGVEIVFEIRLDDRVQWNVHETARLIFKNHFLVFNSCQATAKIALSIDWTSGFHFRELTGKTFVISRFIKPTFEAGRRNFKRISRVDKILNIEDRAKVLTHRGAILVGHAVLFVNEEPNDWLVFGTSDFAVHQ